MAIPYDLPENFALYDKLAVADALVEAKAAVLSLQTIPYQREWVDALQQMELKREVAGTTRIEGADFTEPELERVLKEKPGPLHTRSQRQVLAALKTYRWIPTIPDDRPVTIDLLKEIHSKIVTGADDDHCPPGKLRTQEQNVTFGLPRHRGVPGGAPCGEAVEALIQALQKVYRGHDPLIRALAVHYHIGAMHPFLDGNGRTARALEALLLQRAGLRDTCFIAMSNYYYDEKNGYLAALSAVREARHDLTPFLLFGLKGIASQCGRLLSEIRSNVSKVLFRDVMAQLHRHLKSPRKKVIAERQVRILEVLLECQEIGFEEFVGRLMPLYKKLKFEGKAISRDLNGLVSLGAITITKLNPVNPLQVVRPRLEWPTEITQTELYRKLHELPKAKGARAL